MIKYEQNDCNRSDKEALCITYQVRKFNVPHGTRLWPLARKFFFLMWVQYPVS